jgi:N-carbamoylputrescine amidase
MCCSILSRRHWLEPYDAAYNIHKRWRRVMQGHAIANTVPVVAANRIGLEENGAATQ